MRRRRLAALITAGLATVCLSLVGCGIPNSTDVQVDRDGRGPSPFTGSAGGGDKDPAKPTDTTNPAVFVRNFLQAPAGEIDGSYGRVSAYFSRDARRRTSPPSDVTITIVRPAQEIPTDVQSGEDFDRVRVPIQPVGVLGVDGTISPPPAGIPTSYTFMVAHTFGADEPNRPETGGLAIENPPPGLWMSTYALNEFYQARVIYFWSSDGTTLVPDQRYVPLAVPRERWATEVASWLVNGPADWLRPAVRTPPDGLRLTGNVAETDGLLAINLSPPTRAETQDDELRRLEIQLAWSLREEPGASRFQLRLRNTSRPPVDAALLRQDDPAYNVRAPEQRFCVYNGQVRKVVGSTEAKLPGVPIQPDQNHDVDSAGLLRSGDKVAVALVTGSGGRYRLNTGIDVDQVQLTYTSRQTYPSMSRPVWLKGPDLAHPSGFVVAGGELYRFDTQANLTPVRVPDLTAPVTAVAAALDGRRLAIIAGGRVYVVALAVDGTTVTLANVREVPISLGSPTAVDWVAETDLVVAGTRAGQRGIIDQISIDGALVTGSLVTAGAPVTRLAAYPDNPVFPTFVSRFMYEANGQGWVNRPAENVRIPTSEVMDNPVEGAVPRAPFFLY